MFNDEKKSKLCLQCLACCKEIAVPIDYISPSIVEFYQVRGCRIGRISGGRTAVILPFPCPHLTDKGCDIYDKPERPLVCSQYDGSIDPQMADKCLWIKKNRRK